MPTKNESKGKGKDASERPDRGKPALPKAHVATVAIVVSDRTKATDWYTRVLGLDLVESMEHWVAVGRKGKGGLLHLCQMTEFEPNFPLEPGNSGVTLRVPGADFTAACGQLKANGVEFIEGPKKESWGWYATVRDPDGNELFLMPDL
jgi:catechol 2,3-dioxygenase-like lactoylglutathione lyase family enzyme